MNINSMSRSSMLNSYFGINKANNQRSQTMKSMSGFSGVPGFDYASKNTLRLQSILERRSAQESAYSKEMTEFKQSSTKFYSEFTPKMSELSSAASKLKTTTFDSTLRPMGYGSDNGSAVTAVTGTIDSNKDIKVDVAQIATGQKNAYAEVSATKKGDFAGKSAVELVVGEKKVKIDVNIDTSKTNEDALKEIASKINAEKLGVKAEVVVKEGKAQLSVSSEKTGEKTEFTATITGDAKAALGDAEIKKAQDAKYTVDGKDYVSASNNVTLADGKISATLAGEGKATLSKGKKDTANVLASVKDFASKYNSVVDFLNKNQAASTSVNVMAKSFGNTKYLTDSLSQVGIDVDSSGRLTVNENRFSDAMKTDPAKIDRIIGSGGGLASAAKQKADAALMTSRNILQSTSNRSTTRFYGSPVGVMMDFWA